MAASLGFTKTQAVWADGSGGNTPVDAVDLENGDQADLMNNNTRIELVWNGTTYVLAKYVPATGTYAVNALSDTSRLRRFSGPVDPSTVSGVVLGNYDEWDPVS